MTNAKKSDRKISKKPLRILSGDELSAVSGAAAAIEYSVVMPSLVTPSVPPPKR